MARLTARTCLLICALAAGAGAPGCAKEGVPPGGPEDLEAPGLVEVYPPSGATGVGRGEPIIFRFSETMNRESVEKALFFTPDIGPTFRLTWHGRELRLEPQVRYRENTTIVVTLGADAADGHRNRLGESITIAFSTGSELDDGIVSGQVVEAGRSVPGAWIWIYPVDPERGPADPSPLLPLDRAYPLYITQADDAGLFEQRYMARGTYRLFAFLDRNTNRRFDLVSDPLAVPPADARIQTVSEHLAGLVLNLAPRDTTGPRLRSAAPLDSIRVNLSLSEPPAPGTVPRVAVLPWDEETQQVRPDRAVPAVTAAYRPVGVGTALLVRITGARTGARYQIRLIEAVDAVGNPAEAALRPVLFTVPDRADTTAPRITAVVPADSSRGLNRDTRIRLTFATEIDAGAVPPWRLLGPDTLALTPAWLDPRTLDLTLNADPVTGGWYRLPVPSEQLRSWSGHTGAAEGAGPAWQATAPPGRGTLRLSIVGEAEPPAGGYRLFFEGAGSSAAPLVTLHRATAGEFITPELPSGPYLVWGFADSDGDGVLDTGSARPFVPAEVVAVLPDTLYVRDSFESSYAVPLRLQVFRRDAGGPGGGR